MVMPSPIACRLRFTRTWIGLGVLAPLGMLLVSGLMLLDLRQDVIQIDADDETGEQKS